ncbi:MAG: hypothetical protein ACJATA_001956 [Sphingobacteriales bacterium]|jgi:hypothetical protein
MSVKREKNGDFKLRPVIRIIKKKEEEDGMITMTYRDGAALFSFEGQWNFSDDKEYIFTDFDDDVDKFKIIRLKNNELILEDDDGDRTVFEKVDN